MASRSSTVADELLIDLEIEALPESVFLATSRDLPGLVAQSRTVAETMVIAQDVARKIIESCIAHGDSIPPIGRKRKKIGTTVAVPVTP